MSHKRRIELDARFVRSLRQAYVKQSNANVCGMCLEGQLLTIPNLFFDSLEVAELLLKLFGLRTPRVAIEEKTSAKTTFGRFAKIRI